MVKVADSWVLMWGSAYLLCALVKPDILAGWEPRLSRVTMLLMGLFMLLGLYLTYGDKKRVGGVILFAMGLAETLGGVASWAGLIMWNVPFKNPELFNVSMAFLDLLGAVFLFSRALERSER